VETNTRGAESLATVREFLALNELEGVKNLRIVADCLHCELPFDLADFHDCEVSDV
jgi:vacuolar-type H+-ATPase subunit C/Vma6